MYGLEFEINFQILLAQGLIIWDEWLWSGPRDLLQMSLDHCIPLIKSWSIKSFNLKDENPYLI